MGFRSVDNFIMLKYGRADIWRHNTPNYIQALEEVTVKLPPS